MFPDFSAGQRGISLGTTCAIARVGFNYVIVVANSQSIQRGTWSMYRCQKNFLTRDVASDVPEETQKPATRRTTIALVPQSRVAEIIDQRVMFI
jgi:hypothetical protein